MTDKAEKDKSGSGDKTGGTDRTGRKKGGFLRGVLDGWRSSVNQSQSSTTSCGSQDSPSHSASCGHLGSESREGESPTLGSSTSEDRLRPGNLELDDTVRTPSPSVEPVKPGFLPQPTALAFDPVQRLIAIGNRAGFMRILGWGPSGMSNSDCHCRHPNSNCAVIQLEFVINEGLLISLCSDDSLNLWNIKLKTPEVIQSLKFQRERITYIHLPFQSKWLYIGTLKGNVYIANLDSFCLSGYVVNWNKAIELSQRTHPGSIIHISDCPIDPNKLLIGYETGLIVLWDLRSKTVDSRITYHEPVTSICWNHEGRQFMCSHLDGSLTTWEVKSSKPCSVIYPHAKNITEDLKIEPCRSIPKLEWRTCKNDDPFIIFSGGFPFGSSDQYTLSSPTHPNAPVQSTTVAPASSNALGSNLSIEQQQQPQQTGAVTPRKEPLSTSSSVDSPSKSSMQTITASNTATAAPANTSSTTPPATCGHSGVPSSSSSTRSSTQSLTIIHGRSTTVIEMKTKIVDFVTACETPYDCDFNEPYSILVLLSNDLMVIDLTSDSSFNSCVDSDDEENLPLSSKASSNDGPKYVVTSILPENEPEVLASPFVVKETPEPPKQGFFKGLFSGGPSMLDREELFGESAAGKGSKTLAKHVPGSNFDQARLQTGGLASELMKARQGLTERGEHLNKLEDKSERMANEAEGFKDLSHQLLNKYKDKKWYQF